MDTKTMLLLFALFVSFCGCIKAPPCLNMQFDVLAGADRIIITDNTGKPLRRVTEPSEIKQISGFALSHRSDWETPWSGTPIAPIRANFYQNNRFIGDLGVGDDFLTSQGCGRFQYRPVSETDRQWIMKLFSVEDPYRD